MTKIDKLFNLLESINEAKAGFDLTDMPVGAWRSLLKQFGISETPERMYYNEIPIGFEWKGDGILIATGNNPITGEFGSKSMREPEVGYLSYVGIEGDDDKVKSVYDYILQKATYIKGENPTEREFI